jgi:SAM-dependent methyltransferase
MSDGPARVVLRPTRCAICDVEAAAEELYAPTFDETSFNHRVFSARRVPDRVHYRIVRCPACGLVRSDPVADQASLSALYAGASFDYEAEVPYLRRGYGRYLALARRRSTRPPRRMLDVGCGNGFMLEEALSQGFESVRGVEPSSRAIASAAPSVRRRIVQDVLRQGLFARAAFDLLCMFQVFDHLPEPGAVLDACWEALAPDGTLLCLHHNVRSLSARVLGERSPIVDIEHCYLYSPRTMLLLLRKHGFEVVEVGAASNTLSLRHLVRLLPLPAGLDTRAAAAVGRGRLGELSLRLPLGNLYAIARRPAAAVPPA